MIVHFLFEMVEANALKISSLCAILKIKVFILKSVDTSLF